MPIITFSPKDKMLAIVVEASYQPTRVVKIDGPKASKSGQSINWFIDFEITSGKYEGKGTTIAFTSGSEQPSILGSMMWMPTAWLRQLYAAVKDMAVANVPDSYDTDELLNQVVDAKWEVNTGDAGLFNTISTFLPHGKSATANKPPF